MSFGDLIGKLQSVVSSFGTEETKKTEKKEDVSDNSVFAAAIENVNEETDITGIEIDYSQAADEVADQLFINRNITDPDQIRNSIENGITNPDDLGKNKKQINY